MCFTGDEASFQHRRPLGFSSADNGALHQMLLEVRGVDEWVSDFVSLSLSFMVDVLNDLISPIQCSMFRNDLAFAAMYVALILQLHGVFFLKYQFSFSFVAWIRSWIFSMLSPSMTFLPPKKSNKNPSTAPPTNARTSFGPAAARGGGFGVALGSEGGSALLPFDSQCGGGGAWEMLGEQVGWFGSVLSVCWCWFVV